LDAPEYGARRERGGSAVRGASVPKAALSWIEREYEFVSVAGSERDAGAFVEVIEIECFRAQARSAGFEPRTLLFQFTDALFELALLGLQIDVRDEALAAGHGVRAQVKNGSAEPNAEGRSPMFRHRTDPDSDGR